MTLVDKAKAMCSAAAVSAESHGAFLAELGERVRHARARRGMTRKILSRDSGVSERYLAELESGRGNISITLLRQIAAAMDLPLDELVRQGGETPAELHLITAKLARLDGDGLRETAAWLRARFESDTAASGRIALIGLRGAGKTTLGKALAERLQVPFVELDSEIEREAGMSLSEIFDLWGQPAYRRHERRALERVIAAHDRAVITTGGSLVSEAATFETLLAGCYTVWLKATPEEHMDRVAAQGDYRPMAGNEEAMEDLRQILAGRDSLYRRAHATVDTSGKDLAACLDELAAVASGARHAK